MLVSSPFFHLRQQDNNDIVWRSFDFNIKETDLKLRHVIHQSEYPGVISVAISVSSKTMVFHVVPFSIA